MEGHDGLDLQCTQEGNNVEDEISVPTAFLLC